MRSARPVSSRIAVLSAEVPAVRSPIAARLASYGGPAASGSGWEVAAGSLHRPGTWAVKTNRGPPVGSVKASARRAFSVLWSSVDSVVCGAGRRHNHESQVEGPDRVSADNCRNYLRELFESYSKTNGSSPALRSPSCLTARRSRADLQFAVTLTLSYGCVLDVGLRTQLQSLKSHLCGHLGAGVNVPSVYGHNCGHSRATYAVT